MRCLAQQTALTYELFNRMRGTETEFLEALMSRLVVLVFFFLVQTSVTFEPAAIAAQIGVSSPTLSYTCSNDGEKAKCKCEGFFDCQRMEADKVCKKPITVCFRDAGGREICECDWKVGRIGPSGKISLPSPTIAPLMSR